MEGPGGERLGVDGALPTIWSLAIDPVDPNVLFAGTRPAGLWRSRDGGQVWERLALDIARECSIGVPFVTSVIVDPDDNLIVWAAVEVGNVFLRSLDSSGKRLEPPRDGFGKSGHSRLAIAATQQKRGPASNTLGNCCCGDDTGAVLKPLKVSKKNGRSLMLVGSWSKRMILACCLPGAERLRPARE